jgi:threonine/homoserine/homoserine lactone efflux protein
MQNSLSFFTTILPAITFGFAAAVQPGPLLLYLISLTLRSGWKRSLPGVFSPLITDGPIALVCLFLLSRLPAGFLQYIQVAGGLFLLWLAYKAFLDWKRFKGGDMITTATSAGKTLFHSTIVNFLNPGPYLGWSLVIGPLFLKGWKVQPINGILVIFSFYLTMIVCTMAILLLFHLAKERGPRLQRVLIGLSVLFLGLFGGYQIVMGLL